MFPTSLWVRAKGAIGTPIPILGGFQTYVAAVIQPANYLDEKNVRKNAFQTCLMS
jgi:hypothetical protein